MGCSVLLAYHSGPGTLINSRPTLAHIETMISFGRKRIRITNKKNFLGLRMLEKHLESVGFEPTTVLGYSKPLSNFRGQFGGQGTTGQERDLYLSVCTGKDNTLQMVSALRMFAQKP